MEDDAAEVADFKKEVDQDFDEVLAEVSAAIAAVPLPAAMTLPGLEPLAPPDREDPDSPPPEPATPEPNPCKSDWTCAATERRVTMRLTLSLRIGVSIGARTGPS
jgi:hypothetical protein